MMLRDTEVREFVDYVESFYGDDGIYDLGFKVTREKIWLATAMHLMRLVDDSFEGDSMDREIVRDIMINQHKEEVQA